MGRYYFQLLLCFSSLLPSVCIAQNLAERRAYIDSLCQAATLANDKGLLAECYYMEGKFYVHNNPYMAANWFHKAIELLEDKGPSVELGRLYVQLATLSTNGKISEDKDYYESLARKVILQTGDSTAMQKYVSLFPELVPKDTVSKEYLLLKAYTEKTQRGVDPTTTLEQVIQLYEKEEPGVFIHVTSLLSLSQMYVRKGKVKEALDKIQLAQSYASLNEEIGHNLSYLKQLEKSYFKVDSASEFWESALAHYKRMKEYEEKKFSQDREQAMMELRTQYETEKKQELINQKEKELVIASQNARIRQFFLVFGFILLSITLFAALYLYRLQKRNQVLADRNKMLLREQNHRVKNNLQFISSMLRLQGEEVKSEIAQHQLENTRLRIESMALLQRRLYSNGNLTVVNLKDYSESILETVLESNEMEDVELDLDIEEIDLDIDRTLSYGLILTELAQNSCKYAFKGLENPSIYLTVKLTPEKNLLISYKDNGIGGTRRKSGFGLQMIQYQVAQLKGILTEKDNFDFSVEFKI